MNNTVNKNKLDYHTKKVVLNDKKKLYESIKDIEINNIYVLEYKLELEKELGINKQS